MKIIMFLLICLLSCSFVNGEPIPETWETIEDGRYGILYLTEAILVNHLPNWGSPFDNKSVTNDSYFIFYQIIRGNYPESYFTRSGYLHIIPENNNYILELYSDNNWTSYVNNTLGRTTLIAYSFKTPNSIEHYPLEGNNENRTLSQIIFEYYLRNKEK